jgi:Concanavalin A-like lectin/glucanases superfamily
MSTTTQAHYRHPNANAQRRYPVMRNKTWTIFFFLVGITFLPSVWAQVCTPPPSGLVSWWPGDGNANDIQGINNGAPQNGATFTSGKVGQAFSFDGVDDYVEIPDNPSLQFGDGINDFPFTIDAWIKCGTLNANQTIVSKYNSFVSPRRQEYSFAVELDNKLTVTLFDTSGDFRLGIKTITTVDGNWHHVAVVYNGTENVAGLKLYIDSIEQPATIIFNDPTYVAMEDTSESIKIGATIPATDGNPHELFNGLIDEVEIFNRTLTASEIQAIYDAGSAGKCKFQDSDGDGIPDAQDDCINSIVSSTVVIGDCNSNVPNTVFSNGCTISDRVQRCAESAQNHGQFVSCVSHLTNELKRGGVISGQQKAAIQSCAAQSNIP